MCHTVSFTNSLQIQSRIRIPGGVGVFFGVRSSELEVMSKGLGVMSKELGVGDWV